MSEEPNGAYTETDIFGWTNNLVQYAEDLKYEVFLFNKNHTVYRLNTPEKISSILRTSSIDTLLEFVLGGIEKGLTVRQFEDGEAEKNVIQKTSYKKIETLSKVIDDIGLHKPTIETFDDNEHDLSRIRGVVIECSHKELNHPFYVIKGLAGSNIQRGKDVWLVDGSAVMPFTKATFEIPSGNHLLVVNDDIFVFNQAKLKQLFGYDIKNSLIASKKVAELEANYRLVYDSDTNLQKIVASRPSLVKKLQNLEAGKISQNDIIDHAEEMGLNLLIDDNGGVLITNAKDLSLFIGLANDDFVESTLTGERYEINSKRIVRRASDE